MTSKRHSVIQNTRFIKIKNISFLLLLFVSIQSYSQRAVTSATTNSTGANPESYTQGGQLYQWGQGNDISLESVVYDGETYFVNDLFTQISYKLVRVNGNGGISFDRFTVFAEENSGNFNYAPSIPGGLGNYSMATLLDEPVINRGANDIFKNDATTGQNIERVDVLYNPFKIPSLPTLDKIGFLAIEKDGNSPIKAAVVTSLDGSGNPLTWGPVVTVTAADYGIVTSDFEFSFLANASAGANPTRVGGNTEAVGISMITLSDLGVGTGDTVYGISFFDSNVADDPDLSDVTNTAVFPNAGGGGADIYGGLGAISTSISTLTGTLYQDIDGDGTRDANEPGIANISITVLGSDGGFQTVTTDSNGNYSAFVPEGSTTITVDETDTDLPPNFTRTEGSNPTVVTTVKGQNSSLGNTGYTSDFDNDGVIDLTDIDDDNDGILDTDELTTGATTYDPLGDEDGDLLVNYLDNDDDGTGDGSPTDYTDSNTDGIPDVYDFDNDGIPNHLDLDADNDGIPDNIEAQTTNGYIPPSGAVGSGFTDANNNGLDDNYETAQGGTDITSVNSDSATVTDNPDYLDLDSDEDGISDTVEANLTLSGTVGTNGLDNFIDNGDDYTDVNGSFDDTQTDNFPDDGNNANLGLPNDVDWRDLSTLGELDTDNDGVPDSTDIDDDNDGILDTDEHIGTQNLSYSFSNMSTLDSRDRGAPNDLNRDFIFESGTAGVDDYIFNLNFDNSTPVIIETTIGDNNVARTGNVIVDGNNQAFSTTSGNFQTLTHTPGAASSYQIEISGEDATLTSIVVRSATDSGIILAQFDFGTDSSNLEPGYTRVSNSNVSGTLAVNIVETDTDSDGIPNYLDLDSDNDGIPDNIEGQATASYLAPTGSVGNNGLYDVYENNDTTTATSSLPLTDTDGTGNPDYLDTDSDDDGTSDRIEANLSLSSIVGANGLDSNYETLDDYSDVNGSFDDTPFNDFPDNPAGGEIDWRDATSIFTDNDNDGVIDSVDLDDDNDGILDTDEGIASGPCPTEYNGTVQEETSITNSANMTGAPDGSFGEVYDGTSSFDWDFGQIYPAGTQYQITWRKKNSLATGAPPSVMDLSESEDDITYSADVLPRPENINSVTFETITITSSADFRYIRLSKGTTSTVDYEVDAIGIIPSTGCSLDTDGDGIPNYQDLDSDNDGIPDNIEAQTTQGYSPPDGVYDPATGVDTAYTGGLTPVDTDLDGIEDYLDTDSDNDSFSDTLEAGLTLTGVYGVNGLDNAYDNGDNYTDVNGSFDNSQFDNFPDLDFDALAAGDVDYRDSLFSVDIDRDGIDDDDDLDDDNDGILDTEEGRLSLITETGFNELTTSAFGDNIGATVTPWVLESGTNTNVVEVDGPGGSDYGSNGPEYDATGAAGNYFTVEGSAGVLYQTFTLTESAIVDFGGYISARGSTSGDAKISIYSGTGSGGTILSSTGTRSTANSTNWTKITNSVTLPAGTYSYVVEMDEVINFDEAFVFGSPDEDGDGIPNYIDLDTDNDGIPDNIEAQSTAGYVAPTGSYSLSGIDLAYGTGLTPVNTDGDADPDYLDLDSDGDGTNDILESGLSTLANDGSRVTGAVGNNGLLDSLDDDGAGDTDGDGLGSSPGDNYADVNGTFDITQTDNFTDADSDAAIGGDLDYRDTIVGVDSDSDTIANSTDSDDDNDGIPDTIESDGNDPDGDEDNDGTPNYRDNSDDGDGGPGGTTNYTDSNGDGIPDVYDFDGDGVPNHLDIDSDNDGIPDNIEAQTTLGYVAPTGIGPAMADTDNDGLDDAYDTDCTGANCAGVTGVDLSTPNNDDGLDNPDYLDTDSDNDGTFDVSENNVSDANDASLDSNTGASSDGTPDGIIDPSNFVDTDGDGLADVFEGSDVNDGYDVNDEINTPSTDLPDADSDVNAGVDANSDVDFRDAITGVVTPGVAGNVLWLRADIDVTGTTEVTNWIDQSSSPFNATSDGATAPSKTSNGLNFNPILDFDGVDNDMVITSGILGTATYTNLWSYVVFKPDNRNADQFIFHEVNASGDFHTKLNGTGNDIIRQKIGAIGTEHVVTVPSDITTNYGLYTFGSTTTAGNVTNGNNQAISKEGFFIGNQNSTITATGNDSDFNIGSIGSGNFLDGQIAEIMIFNETPTSLKQQQIESYLAIKYGFTINQTDDNVDIVDGDYILEDQSTKIWDYTANTAYHNDIAGIGRDDAMALNQKQSKSVNSDAIITIGLGAIVVDNETNANTFASNKDFLVWGNNNGSLLVGDVFETELICAPEKTLARTWKIVETGNVAETQITVDKATVDAALVTANTVKVFKVADDASFTTNVEYIPLVTNGTLYETDYNFNGTKYFTYAEINGIFWTGDSNAWSGGNSVGVTDGPSTNVADRDKVMIIDAGASGTNATIIESVEVECVWIKENSKLMVSSDTYLEFDENFILDGELRLIGDGQLVQTHIGLSNVEGSGKVYKDQAAQVPNVYRYHYWSSPVRELSSDNFRVGQVMKDGTTVTSENSAPFDITFLGDLNYDGAPGVANVTPISISSYWIYTNLNDPGDGSAWIQQRETGVVQRGQGYSMKSTGVSPQNFTFVGTPNDGSITLSIDPLKTSLLGNPYPSALDTQDFITTNIDAIDGTLYFWEHTGEDSSTGTEGHNSTAYQGGYSQRNISMGVAANNIESATQYTLDWETATDNGLNVTQNIVNNDDGVDITATVTFSSGDAQLVNAGSEGGSSGNVITRTEGLGTYTMVVSFDNIVDAKSIFLYNDIVGGETINITVSTPNGSSNADVAQVLVGNTGVNIPLTWTDISTMIISSDAPFNIALDNISFTKGGEISFGDGTYTPPNRYMAVGQGFFVSSSATGGTIRFENSQRNYRNNNFGDGGTFFYRGNNTNTEDTELDLLPVIKLGFGYYNGNEIPLHRQIGISFRDANTFQYDNGYDSQIFDINATDMYWNFDQDPDKNLIIAGVPAITSQLEVPITLDIDTNESIFLMIDEKRNIDKTIFIHDKLTGIYYDMTNQVELNLPKGSYKNRFFLTFNQVAILSVEEVNNTKALTIFVNQDNKELIIQNLDNLDIRKIELFNILGQKIKSWDVHSNENEIKNDIKGLKANLYIANVYTSKGKVHKKIIIE